MLPCIVIALTPQFSTSLQNSIVSSTVGKQRILHVIGTEQPLTNVVKILIYRILVNISYFGLKYKITSLTSSGFFNKAAPIPPWTLNSFGHPYFNSLFTSSLITLDDCYLFIFILLDSRQNQN